MNRRVLLVAGVIGAAVGAVFSVIAFQSEQLLATLIAVILLIGGLVLIALGFGE